MMSVSKFYTNVANGKKQHLSCSWRESKQFVITRFYNSSVKHFQVEMFKQCYKTEIFNSSYCSKTQKIFLFEIHLNNLKIIYCFGFV